MTYAISDIHGCYDKYRELLKNIDFSSNDTLYVLGDAIDRGPDGFKVLLDMASRPNVVGLMGNHEAMAIRAIPGILRGLLSVNGIMSEEDADAKELWFYNGGELSLADFLWLEDGQAQKAWNYMRSLPLYQEIEVGGKSFVLLHGGLNGFVSSRPLSDYDPREILWCRPEPDTIYYSDKYLVLGHTPTQLFYDSAETAPQHPVFYLTDSFIDIDCGCVFPGGRLGCLCLDTMEEIYV